MALVLALWGFTSYLYGEYLCYLKLQPAMVPNQTSRITSLMAQGELRMHTSSLMMSQEINPLMMLKMGDSGKAL